MNNKDNQNLEPENSSLPEQPIEAAKPEETPTIEELARELKPQPPFSPLAKEQGHSQSPEEKPPLSPREIPVPVPAPPAPPVIPKTSYAPEEEKPYTPPPVPPPPVSSFTPKEEFPREREFFKKEEPPREREFIPSKKEKEFISREAETSKEIIRTFQKDLLRRTEEVRREEKIPEKEIVGFTPPKPPELPQGPKPPKFKIPPIPKISLKFAIIISVVILFLSGFYLIYQLKPCLPLVCKKALPSPTPTPSLPLCDKETLKNICPKPEESFPACDLEKLCQELNIAPCQREKICQTILPPVCEPIKLVAPISFLPPLPEEKITISQKSREAILLALNSILKEDYQKPALIRILPEYSPAECQKNWLSSKELFEAFGIKTPEYFLSNLKENYDLIYYLPDGEEEKTCLASQIYDVQCYGPRLAIVFSPVNSNLIKSVIQDWEKTFIEDFKSFILATTKEGEIKEFKDYLYKERVPLRYINLPVSTTALNYGFYKDFLIIGTSKNSFLKTVDLLLSTE